MLGVTLGHPNVVSRLLKDNFDDLTVIIGESKFSGDRIAVKPISGRSNETDGVEISYEYFLSLNDDEAMAACRVGSLSIMAKGELIEKGTPVVLLWGGDPCSSPPPESTHGPVARAAELAQISRDLPSDLDFKS
jgi:hypothetical protein